MKQKILSSIIVLIFSLSLSYYYGGEYIDFHQGKINKKEQVIKLDKNLEDFSLEKLQEIKGIYIYETPDTSLLDMIVEKIEKAKTRVYLETYILTEKRIQKALKKVNEKIDVKVLLEENVYMNPSLNKKSFNNLKNAGVNVRYTNGDSFSLNHSKMMIIDNLVILSTGNYSYSSFKYNREFFLFIDDNYFVDLFKRIFKNDFDKENKYFYDDNLIISPDYTRVKFEKLLSSAKKDIKIYGQNFSDKKILDLLIKLKNKGINIEIILPSLKKISSNKDEIEIMREVGIKVKNLEKPYAHAKSILVDDSILYIGSINFSSYSIDRNRELGLLIKNKKIIKDFLKVFNIDFKK